MNPTRTVVLALGLASIVACSSKDGGVRRATFDGEARVPGSSQVYLDTQDVQGETVSLAVRVRELDGIASSNLLLEFDPVRLVYFSWLPGDLLEQAAGPVAYQVFETVPGSLRMQVSRSAGSVDAGSDDRVLVIVRFKVVAIGETPAVFDPSSAILDDGGAPIPGVQFYAGVFSGS